MTVRVASCVAGVLVLAALSHPAPAQDAATTERMVKAMEVWLAENDIDKGAISVTYNGEAVSTHGFAMPADAPVEMASLGKAITAICAHTFVLDGALSWDDPVADLVPGAPAGPTLGELVTHTSGLTQDSTQINIYGWLNSSEDFAPQVIKRIAARGGVQGAQGAYVYNNENYALLGLAIEAVSDTGLEQTCIARVLTPAGATGARSDRTGPFLAFGGWSLSVAEYAKFHAHWFGAASQLGQEPFSAPAMDTGGGAYYGLGMSFRAFRESHNFWHFGLWCFPGRLNAGSYVVSFEGGWGAVAAFDGCHDWDVLIALDDALARAVYPR